MEANKSPKNTCKFICEKCDYKCNKKSEFSKKKRRKRFQNQNLSMFVSWISSKSNFV